MKREVDKTEAEDAKWYTGEGEDSWTLELRQFRELRQFWRIHFFRRKSRRIEGGARGRWTSQQAEMRNYKRQAKKRKRHSDLERVGVETQGRDPGEEKANITGLLKAPRLLFHHWSCEYSLGISRRCQERLYSKKEARFHHSRDLVLGIFLFLFAILVKLVCWTMDSSMVFCFLFSMEFAS